MCRVRVYQHDDGTFDVWAFNGRIGKTQVMQPKAIGTGFGNAILIADHQVAEKQGGGYKLAEGQTDQYTGKPFEAVNNSIPGHHDEKVEPVEKAKVKPVYNPKKPKVKPEVGIDEDIMREVMEDFEVEFGEQEYEEA